MHARATLLAALVTVAVVASCVGTAGDDVRVASGPASTAAEVTTTTIDPMATCAGRLTPEQSAGELLMALVANPGEAADLVAGGMVGSYALKGNQSAAVGAQVEATDAANVGPFPILVASDEEGGTVQRLREVLGREPAAADVVDALDPAGAEARAADYAGRMGELGFDMVLAPVLDVGGGAGLETRSYGDDPDLVADYGLAVAAGIRAAGLVPVVKHWPGLGRGTADPHDARTDLPPVDELRTVDMVPFDRAIDADIEAIMVTHASVPGLTGDVPASRSPEAITGELRGREGFDGLVITDSLGMGASLVGTTQPLAAEAAILAGADLAMVSGVPASVEAHAHLVDAIGSGRIPADRVVESVGRVLATKGIDPLRCPVG